MIARLVVPQAVTFRAEASETITRANMADRPSSPTPEEREKLDKEAKQKEQEEQSKLPYKWTQQIGDVDITAQVPGNMKGKDMDVKMTKTSIKAGLNGQEPLVEVCLREFPQIPTKVLTSGPGHIPTSNRPRRIDLDT